MKLLLLMFLTITGKCCAFPTQDNPDENDGETSRKVLGSSVVTSVSVILDSGNGSKAYFADAVGKPVSKPQTGSQVASPINLLNPDRYEFYTFDDNGDLIKRLMTLDEIQGIIANGDGENMYNSDAQEQEQPEKHVDEIVNNIQNVLKGEMETHKPSDNKPVLDTPDVSSTWSMILPAIFGNSGEDIKPERPNAVMTPDTIMLEESTMLQKSEILKTTTELVNESITIKTPIQNEIEYKTEAQPTIITTTDSIELTTEFKITDNVQNTTPDIVTSTEQLKNVISKDSTTTEKLLNQNEEKTIEIKPIENTELKSASIIENQKIKEDVESTKLNATSPIPIEILTTEPTKPKNNQTLQKEDSPSTTNAQNVSNETSITTINSLSNSNVLTTQFLNTQTANSNQSVIISSTNKLVLSTDDYENDEKTTILPSQQKEHEEVTTLKTLISLDQATKTTLLTPTINQNSTHTDDLLQQLSTKDFLYETTTLPLTTTDTLPIKEIKVEVTTITQNDLQEVNSNNIGPSILSTLEKVKNANNSNEITKDENFSITTENIPVSTTTQDEPNTSQILNDNSQSIEIGEILNQLLLTTTNIYEINTELSDTTETIMLNNTVIPLDANKSADTTFTITTTTTDYETTTLIQTTPSTIESFINLVKINDTTKNNNVTSNEANDENAVTTENVISSIEQLILQASTQPENILNAESNSANIQSVLENSNSKPMSVLQVETATVASQLLNNEESTEGDSLGNALDSIISQITNGESTTIENVINITTSAVNRKEEGEKIKITTTKNEISTNESNPTKSPLNMIPTIGYKSETVNEPTEESVKKDEQVNVIKEELLPQLTRDEEKIDEQKKNKKDNEMEKIPQNMYIRNESVTQNKESNTFATTINENVNLTLKEQMDNDLAASNKNNFIPIVVLNNTDPKIDVILLNKTNNLYINQTDQTSWTKEATLLTEVMQDISTTETVYNDEQMETTSLLPEIITEKEEMTTKFNEAEKPTASESKISTITESIILTTNKVTTEKLNNITKLKESVTPATTTITFEDSKNSTWTLVSTVAPHKEVTNKPFESSTPVINVDPPKPVNLVNHPVQGFGLEDSTSALDSDVYRFVELCNELAFGFWKSVTNGISTARSVIVSPFAATSLLAMVFLGARGATSGEMNEILKLDDMVTFNPHLIFKNVSESIDSLEKKDGVAVSAIVRELYSDRSKGKLLSFYKERAKQFYDGHVEEASFKEIGDIVRRRTNLIVKRQSSGKIQEFVKDTPIILRPPLAGVSASIYQTDCSEASIEGRDGELYFIVLPTIRQRRLIPVPAAVWRTNFLAGYDPTLDATAVSIGMKDQTISTIFVIPGQQGIAAPGDGLNRLEKRLVDSAFKSGAWSRLLRTLIPRPGLEVQIPRFSHRSVINATSGLQRMGLKDLFSSEKADLRGLNGVANELYLSDILQINNFATCAEVPVGDAHHSEIYPATARRSFRKSRKLDLFYIDDEEPRDYQRAFHDPLHDPTFLSIPLPLRPRQARLPETPRLRFDRPFLYFVRHNPTGLILHMGRFNPRLLP